MTSAISEHAASAQSRENNPDGRVKLNDFHSRYEHLDYSYTRKNTNGCFSVLFFSNDIALPRMSQVLTKLASNGAVSLNIQKEEEEEGMSAGQAHLPSKQQSHYGEEYGQNKEYIGGAHHCVVGELIWLSSNLLDVEAHWEYEGSHTEEDHCDRGKTQKEEH